MLMPDTDENQQAYPQQRAQKPGLGFPIVRMVGLLSFATGACLNYAVGPYQGKDSGESSLLSKLLGILGVKDLLIADRYYCTYAIIALMLEKRFCRKLSKAPNLVQSACRLHSQTIELFYRR